MAKDNPILSAIVAVSENNVIGAENDLPWRLSNDLKWFKKSTIGKPILMGRKTFKSLPGLLPGRTNIILTRDPDFTLDGGIVTRNLDDAIAAGQVAAKTAGAEEIVVIGGAEIYRLTLPLINRLYLTRVHTEIEGDTFFPELETTDWVEVFNEFHGKSEKDMFDHSFTILERIRP
ncbi:dihydrofolate reductase [Sneathiella marina]|uniref:Dihydrofolate reductase n=1 Tax=Sneathiella marina TaxID=2950108 RepID=A0ABY4W095_9PROT|nr:dihydrofolate reductase [Sneathiella marina]USG60606.1 dihydrofolate reductase [Sneathiella marina]